MITRSKIEKAKSEIKNIDLGLSTDDERIRLAYEWLDAQMKTKNPRNPKYSFKDLIEEWCGSYISQSDVAISAQLHPEIKGEFPFYNISTLLTEPSIERIKKIYKSFNENLRQKHLSSIYTRKEK